SRGHQLQRTDQSRRRTPRVGRQDRGRVRRLRRDHHAESGAAEVTIEIIDESGFGLDVEHFAKLARFVMDQMRVHPEAELCIKAVDEDTIATLNEQWMGKQGPTDVLAFPMDELLPGELDSELDEGVLGDLVLAPAVAERQGEAAGHGLQAELELLTTHGILHLLGYDHAEPEEHQEMFGLQARLLTEWGSQAKAPQ